MSGKNPPPEKSPPRGIRGRVRVSFGIGLGLASGGFFPAEFFPRTPVKVHRIIIKFRKTISFRIMSKISVNCKDQGLIKWNSTIDIYLPNF